MHLWPIFQELPDRGNEKLEQAVEAKLEKKDLSQHWTIDALKESLFGESIAAGLSRSPRDGLRASGASFRRISYAGRPHFPFDPLS